jgi:hypothetical protein
VDSTHLLSSALNVRGKETALSGPQVFRLLAQVNLVGWVLFAVLRAEGRLL